MKANKAERILPLKNMRDPNKLLVHEIYTSIQGESTFSGEICSFIRTTACHLRCSYCDTANAFYQGTEKSVDNVLQEVIELGTQLVEITGGEPLLQKPVFNLLQRLCDKNFTVLLETSGGVSIAQVDKRVRVILDIKTPGSGEVSRNIWSNLEILWPNCEVKFVICDENDYEFAKEIMVKYNLSSRCKVLISHEARKMPGHLVASWVIRDKLPVRFQTQLHKVLWGEATGV